MKVDIKLFSQASIRSAIQQLRQAQENLRWGVNETVEILVKDGEMIANDKYGGMAEAVGYMPDENIGIIASVGEANLIAEFGAGDATIPGTGFENAPETPTYAGSYSEEHSRMYADYGWWKFGGEIFHEVQPRMGLYNAKNYIEKNGNDIAREVIKL